MLPQIKKISTIRATNYDQSLEGMTFHRPSEFGPRTFLTIARFWSLEAIEAIVGGNQRIVSIVLTFWGRSGQLGRSSKKIRQSLPWPAQIKKDNANRWRRPRSWQLLKNPFTWNFSFRGWGIPQRFQRTGVKLHLGISVLHDEKFENIESFPLRRIIRERLAQRKTILSILKIVLLLSLSDPGIQQYYIHQGIH